MRLKIKAGSFKFFLQVLSSSSAYLNHPFHLGGGHAYMKADREFHREDGDVMEYKGVFFTIPLDIVDDELQETMMVDDIGSFANMLEDCEDDTEITFMYTECPDGSFVEVYIDDEVQNRLPVDLSTGGYPDMSEYGNTCPGLDIRRFGTDEIVMAHINKGLCVVFEMKKPGDVEEFKEFIHSISQKKKLEYEGENFMGQAAKKLAKSMEQENKPEGTAPDTVAEDSGEQEKDSEAEESASTTEENTPEPKKETPPAKKVKRRTPEEIERDKIAEYSSYLEDRGFRIMQEATVDKEGSPSEQIGLLMDQIDGLTTLVRERLSVLESNMDRMKDPSFVLDRLREWLGQESR